jgi:hypothetical protein
MGPLERDKVASAEVGTGGLERARVFLSQKRAIARLKKSARSI